MDEPSQNAAYAGTQHAIQHDAPAVLGAIRAAFEAVLAQVQPSREFESARRAVLERLQPPTERAFEETLAAIRDELRGQVE